MANKSQSSSIRRLIGDTHRATGEVGQLEKIYLALEKWKSTLKILENH
jgi:hypothetical protein